MKCSFEVFHFQFGCVLLAIWIACVYSFYLEVNSNFCLSRNSGRIPIPSLFDETNLTVRLKV